MEMRGFRCPNCGQAHEMEFNCILLNMNETMNELYVNGTKATHLTISNLNMEVICSHCNEASKIKEWIEAFEEPLKYFEMDNLCHCGGELWMDNIPNTKTYAFVCEKCNWVKPKQIVSGH